MQSRSNLITKTSALRTHTIRRILSDEPSSFHGSSGYPVLTCDKPTCSSSKVFCNFLWELKDGSFFDLSTS